MNFYLTAQHTSGIIRIVMKRNTQTGAGETAAHRVEIFQRPGRAPHGFEWETRSGALYIEGALTFDGKQLIDYDGCFFLPAAVAEKLRAMGYTVPATCLK